MRIFISLKVPRGNQELESLANTVMHVVRAAGHDPFVAPREIIRQGLSDPRDFMPFVRQQAKTCDLMIVLYHPELRGGLIEMGLAYAHHTPIWLCYKTPDKSGPRVSSSAVGCADLTIEYASPEELSEKLAAQLRGLKKEKR